MNPLPSPLPSPLTDPALKKPRRFYLNELDDEKPTFLVPPVFQQTSRPNGHPDDAIELPDCSFSAIELQFEREVSSLISSYEMLCPVRSPTVAEMLDRFPCKCRVEQASPSSSSSSGPTISSFPSDVDLLGMSEELFALFVSEHNWSGLSLHQLQQLRNDLIIQHNSAVDISELKEDIQNQINNKLQELEKEMSQYIMSCVSASDKHQKRNKRSQSKLPDCAKEVLSKWFLDHWQHPYPTLAEREQLARETGLDSKQVHNYFINTRVRVWKPTLHVPSSWPDR